MVVYRIRYHANLKRNLQIMPGGLKLLLQHVLDLGEHLVVLTRLGQQFPRILDLIGRRLSHGNKPIWIG